MEILMVDFQHTKDLVNKAKAGDRVAYGQLVERYADRLRRLVVSRIGVGLEGVLESEDAMQEILHRALKAIRSFEYRSEDSFLHWLGGIAENLIRNTARAKDRAPKMDQILEIPSKSTSPSMKLRREERFERLQKALADLPEDYRQVIRLSRIEGLKTKDIAERMGRSPDAVKQLVVRALKKLKDSFGDTESFHLPARKLDTEL